MCSQACLLPHLYLLQVQKNPQKNHRNHHRKTHRPKIHRPRIHHHQSQNLQGLPHHPLKIHHLLRIQNPHLDQPLHHLPKKSLQQNHLVQKQ